MIVCTAVAGGAGAAAARSSSSSSSASASDAAASSAADEAGSRARRTLWVSGLDESATAALVRAACIPFGDISEVQVPIDNKTGKHRGFAFVEFELEADARECVDNLHGAELAGRTLRVTVARPQRAKGQGKAVWSAENWFKSLADGAGGEEAGAAAGGGAEGGMDDDGGGEAILPPLGSR